MMIKGPLMRLMLCAGPCRALLFFVRRSMLTTTCPDVIVLVWATTGVRARAEVRSARKETMMMDGLQELVGCRL